MIYAAPGAAGAKIAYKAKYDNFIGGKWVAPVKGQYFDVITPVNGKPYTKAARSTVENIELALDAAHAAFPSRGKTSPAERSNIPLAVDHFRYFAGCLRAQEGALSNIDENTVAYHFHESLGVVGQIIHWNFPILIGAGKLPPAIGVGYCVVLKPAESTPISILILAELIVDLLPPTT